MCSVAAVRGAFAYRPPPDAREPLFETIWLQPEVAANDNGERSLSGGQASSALPLGGDDGVGGYGPLAVVTGAGGGASLSWVHGNHLGVPLLYADGSGAQVTPAAHTMPGFPGQLRTLADLYYNRHRDYDSSTGRYIQADPIGLEGGANAYLYANSNPLKYIDPTGEFGIAGAAGGAAFNLALQVGVNWYSTGNLKAALLCVDWGDIAVSAAIGFAGPTVFGNVILGNRGPFGLTRIQTLIYGLPWWTAGSAFKSATPPIGGGHNSGGGLSEILTW